MGIWTPGVEGGTMRPCSGLFSGLFSGRLPAIPAFCWRYGILIWLMRRNHFGHSPYTSSRLVHLLAALTLVYAPRRIVQLGVGEGVSTIAMLLAARLKVGNGISLTGYDSFSHRAVGETIPRERFERNIAMFGMEKLIHLIQIDLLESPCREEGIDLLNIDIDNSYHKLHRMYDMGWFGAVSDTGLILVEGGYSKHTGFEESRGIMKFCRELQQKGFQTMTIQRYPGLVLVRKFRDCDEAY